MMEPDKLPDLVEYKGIAFTRVVARKPTECWHCLGDIEPGDTAFAPIGNVMERYRRLDLRCGRIFEAKL